jgi:two-component system sensor histidine kinase BarA
MEYPIIDWDLGTKLAGNNLQTAQEMLTLLVGGLPGDLAQIKEAFAKKQNDKMMQYVHRLHGALCYCGTPRLKAVTQQLEIALKQNKTAEMGKLFAQFEREAKQLIESYHAEKNQSK